MKILHTSDLHLDEKAPERWQALKNLVSLAGTLGVGVLTIAGDLFDSNTGASALRTRLRALFQGVPFQTLILPGNHDCGVYRPGLYFGDNVIIMDSWTEPELIGKTAFWGPPYQAAGGEALAANLMKAGRQMAGFKSNVLLYHGELLDASFSQSDAGEEGSGRYMPARLSYFEGLPLDYVLAGHFHRAPGRWKLPGGGLFIYPGSPVSVTRREKGRRSAVLLSPGAAPVEIYLDSFHYEEKVLSLDPFWPGDPLAELESELEKLHPQARLMLAVKGLYNGDTLGMTEKELTARVKALAVAAGGDDPVFNMCDVRSVLSDELFSRFREKLVAGPASTEVKERALKLTVSAFRAVKIC